MKKDEKQCNQCGEIKSLDEFYSQNKKRVNGEPYIYYNPECKSCTIDRSTKRMYENYEKHLEYIKNNNNRPEVRKKHKDYTKKYRESGKQLKWQRENKDKTKEYNAKKRYNSLHDISEEEWLSCKEFFSRSCSYCGLSESEHYVTYAGELKKTDLHKDHVDPQGSNGIENCVPACKRCNVRKNEMTLEQFSEREEIESWRIEKINTWLLLT